MTLGLWTHQACLEATESESPRESFRRFWEYVQEGGFEAQLLGCGINVTHDLRPAYENETRAFLSESNATLGGMDAASIYMGFKELQFRPGSTTPHFAPATSRPWYVPYHLIEPINSPAVLANLDLDIFAHRPVSADVVAAFETGDVKATGRINRAGQFGVESDYPNYGVTLIHPGVKPPDSPTALVASIPISCNDALIRVEQTLNINDLQMNVWVYDTTPNSTDVKGEPGPFFLCGGTLYHDGVVRDEGSSVKFCPEIPMDEILHTSGRLQRTRVEALQIASREWTVVMSVHKESGPNSQMAFISLGAILILISSICLSCLIYINAKNSNIKASLVAEKAKLRLESARKAAKQERELNDFIAHEVRNPLNAALAANTFVSASVSEEQPLITEVARRSVREDVKIIDNSLHFINDLLRNMLDIQRAKSHQLNIDYALVELKRDVLEPAASMLYRRGATFEVIVDCPFDDLVVESDPLRLTQILLNLGRNSAKFVDQGFVRFRTAVVDGSVLIYVEDSGPGVPVTKQENAFGKFQESLDSLNQGTGIGLALCKDLTELLGGRIWLDREYNSG
ncbi:MAG: hypothetical protein SGILL_005603, partial [Bacillariaceae sp.]